MTMKCLKIKRMRNVSLIIALFFNIVCFSQKNYNLTIINNFGEKFKVNINNESILSKINSSEIDFRKIKEKESSNKVILNNYSVVIMFKEIIPNNNSKELFISASICNTGSGCAYNNVYTLNKDIYTLIDSTITRGEMPQTNYPISFNNYERYFYSGGNDSAKIPFKIPVFIEIFENKFKIVAYGDKEEMEKFLIRYLDKNKLKEIDDPTNGFSDDMDNGEREGILNFLLKYYLLKNTTMGNTELLFYKAVNDISDKHKLWKEIKISIIKKTEIVNLSRV
jgi:hypothetical protein